MRAWYTHNAMEEEEKQPDPVAPQLPQEDSSISMLRKSLYSRDEPEELKKRASVLFAPEQPHVMEESMVKEQPELIDAMSIRTARQKKIGFWVAIGVGVVIIFILAVVLTMWYRGTQQVSQSQVGVSITAPANFIAGGALKYVVTVTNNSHVAWGNVNVLFTLPQGFIYTSSTPTAQVSVKDMTVQLPPLASKASETFEVVGQLVGDQGNTSIAQVQVTVSPANYPKEQITQTAQTSTVLSAIPLDVSIEATKQAAVGERIAAIIHIRNLGTTPIENAVLQLSPDPGMQLATEDSGFSPDFSVLDSFWRLPPIKPLDQIDRYAVLYVQGNAGDQRQLGITINELQNGQTYTLRNIAQVITVSTAQVAVSQSFNGSSSGKFVVSPNQAMTGELDYKNMGTTGLTDAIVKVHFEGAGLDASTIKLKSGSYDPTNNTITWTAASLPELKNILPGQSGKIPYSFNILPYNQLPLAKNQQLVATASIDSPDLPAPTGQSRQVISDRYLMPISAGILLGMDAFYDDGRLGIVSAGPLPPQVGQQTTYTVRVHLGSTSNDVSNMQVKMVLPDGVSYTNHTYMSTGSIDYNDRTNTVVWTINPLKGLTGRSIPQEELDFQVGITPGADKRGHEVLLVQSITAAGTDSYVGGNVKTTLTDMPTTRTASPQNGDVQ